MGEERYVLRSVENMRVDKAGPEGKQKTAVKVILVVLIVGSFLLGDNLFSGLNWIVRLLLIGLFFKVMFTETKEFVPYPIEIHFFEDGLRIDQDYVYYSKKLQKKESYQFKYSDIESCSYKKSSGMLMVQGKLHVDRSKYRADGTVSSTPDESKQEKSGMCFFYANADPKVDFVKEIEAHSPIKVEIN